MDNSLKMKGRVMLLLKSLLWLCLVSLLFMSPYSRKTGRVVQANDSVKIAISERYNNPSLMKQIFMGNNYREEWATPVTFPIFRLQESGMEIIKLGGGQQTLSLRLMDKDSEEWVLRTVDKDVTNAVPSKYRNKLTVSFVQDMVSAAHPYAPLIVPVLARATGIAAADPVFYYVPDDAALGDYRKIFAGKICMLERREIIPGNPETKSTEAMLDNLLGNGSYSINGKAYLKARLLDMLIADWDRHYDQWIWYEQDSGHRKILLPLPRDRDQALFNAKGLMVKIVPLVGVKHFVGLRPHTRQLINLNAKSWNLDKLVLETMDKNEWQTIVEEFVFALSDEVIEQAIKKMPPEIYALSGKSITAKLIGRKNSLSSDAMQYYNFLAKEAVLYGHDQDELFSIEGLPDRVVIDVRNKQDTVIRLQRSFLSNETGKISIYGLGGNDAFSFKGQLPKDLEIYINGGKGINTYTPPEVDGVHNEDSNADAATFKHTLFRQLRIPLE